MPIGTSDGRLFKDALEAELDSSSYPIIQVMDSTGFRQSPNIDDRRNRHPLQNAMDALKGSSNLGVHMPVENTTALGDDLGNFDLDMMSNPDAPTSNDISSTIQTFMGQQQPTRSVVDVVTGKDGKERYKTWPEKLFDTVVDAFKLPGDVYSGKEDPGSEKAIGRATELAGALIFGPAPIARKVADGTLGSFAGVKSTAIPKELIQKANQIMKEGADADELFKQTKLFAGVDGKLRYEISDENAKLKLRNDEIGTIVGKDLDKVLDHPDLFKAYPELKNVKVQYDPYRTRQSAVFMQDGNEGKGLIKMGPETMGNPSILLHEIQHWIQKKEGFASGGAGMTDDQFRLRFSDELNRLEDEFFKINKSDKELTPDQIKRRDFISSVFIKDAERWEAAKAETFANYQRLAGEVEARNVQHRFDNLRTYPALKEEWDIKDALYAKGYDAQMSPNLQWIKADAQGVEDFVFKTKDGKSHKFSDLPEDIQKIAERLNSIKTSDIHPLKTMDTPAEQQFVSSQSQWAGPYGYGWEINTVPPPY